MSNIPTMLIHYLPRPSPLVSAVPPASNGGLSIWVFLLGGTSPPTNTTGSTIKNCGWVLGLGSIWACLPADLPNSNNDRSTVICPRRGMKDGEDAGELRDPAGIFQQLFRRPDLQDRVSILDDPAEQDGEGVNPCVRQSGLQFRQRRQVTKTRKTIQI